MDLNAAFGFFAFLILSSFIPCGGHHFFYPYVIFTDL